MALTIITKKGFACKIATENEVNLTRRGASGIKIMTLVDGDEIVGGANTNDDKPIVIVTKKGKLIAFRSTEIRLTRRGVAGVRAIRLADGDEVAFILEEKD